MRRMVITALLATAVFVVPAKGNPLVIKTGNDLLEACDAAPGHSLNDVSVGSVKRLVCIYYVKGLGEGMEAAGLASGNPVLCRPATVTARQMMAIAQKALHAEPEVLHESADLLVAKAFIAAFPCHGPKAAK